MLKSKKRFCLPLTKGFIILILFLSLAFISPASAEKADYIYDNLGRVIKAVSETGDAAVYTYDEVGNLISITGGVTQPQPPQLYSISPNVIFVGTAVTITIQGKNLIATEEVTSDNPGMIVESFSSTDTTITVNANISSTAATGLTNINIKTPFGLASIPVNIVRLTFTPAQVTLTPGASSDVTAIIEGLSNDYALILTNQNPDIISAPQSVIIPAFGSIIFPISALKEGTGVITAGNSGLQVYVTQQFTGAGTAYAAPVSLVIKQPLQGGTTSLPVSVVLSAPLQETITSSPVSIEVLPNLNGTVLSEPVSAVIQKP